MKILVASNAFKGTISAAEIGDIACDVFGDEFTVVSHPLADGGDGTLAVLAAQMPGSLLETVRVQGPLPGQSVDAQYLLLAGNKQAFVEMARSSGLVLVPEDLRDPKITTTKGVGELIQHAAARGVEQIYLAIGGSATNDGGLGMLSALGWRFLQADGREVACAAELVLLDRIIPGPALDVSVTVLCDVSNPLTGPNGASAVYGPQKGADDACIRLLDDGLRRLSEVVKDACNVEIDVTGAGAAGGLGAGAFFGLNAKIRSGFEAIADLTDLRGAIASSDVVISGEGNLDSQSLQGKVISGIIEQCRAGGKPLVLVVGRSDLDQIDGVSAIVQLVGQGVDTKRAMQEAKGVLRQRFSELKQNLPAILAPTAPEGAL